MRRFRITLSTSLSGLTSTNTRRRKPDFRMAGGRVGALRPALLLLVSAAMMGLLCASVAAPAEELKPYEQTIPGTVVKFNMIPVPAGTYEMADPSKPDAKQKVAIKSFWMGKTEVTWDEYDVYAFKLDAGAGETKTGEGADAVSRPSPAYGDPTQGFGHEGYPAIGITRYAAEQYCRWLSLKTGKKYRLPTETEWEYACRAGTLPAGPIGDKAQLARYAWFLDNADYQTQPVGKKEPNAWGLHDTLGNAAEWCAATQDRSVVRGGSFSDSAEKVHPAACEKESPDWDASDPQFPKGPWWLQDAPFVGFRVVCEP